MNVLGALPPANKFAGAALDFWLPGGELFRCGQCQLWFRHPSPSDKTLAELYQRAPRQAWQYEPARRSDWSAVLTIINAEREPCAVLDIGCYDGAFLSHLEPRHSRHGIEVNSEAASRARERSVNIVGRTADSLRVDGPRFDYITAFDVIEHVRDPLTLVKQAVERLSQHGSLYLGSASTDARSWRYMKNRYWYCANPEHLSFISPDWAQHVAEVLGIEAEVVLRYSHAPGAGLRQRSTQALRNTAMRVAPRMMARARLLGMGERTALTMEQAMYPPDWSSARDHILVRFQRPA